MGNQVGVQTRRATVGPLPVSEGTGDKLFIALTAERGFANVASGAAGAIKGAPQLVTGMASFESKFGGATPYADGTRYSEGYEVLKAFFGKGGTRAYVQRIVGATAEAAHVTLQDRAGSPVDTIECAAKGPGTWANEYRVVVSDGTQSDTFKIEVYPGDPATTNRLEAFDNLRVVSGDIAAVNDASQYIQLTDLSSVTAAPANRPANGTFQMNATNAGVDDNAPAAADIVGTEAVGVKTSLKGFRSTVYGRGILCAPGLDTDATVVSELTAQTESYKRLYWTCSDEGASVATAITQRADHDNRFTGFWFPRAKVRDPLSNEIKTISPVGHLAADFFKIVNSGRLSKAPAGADFPINFSIGIEEQANGAPLVDEGVSETLVAAGINPIWDRNRTGPKSWGARAATNDGAWRFIQTGYVWTVIAERASLALDSLVFDEVDEALFQNIRVGVFNLMVDMHNNGAFIGEIPSLTETPDPDVHAFDVQCNASLLTDSDLANGNVRVNVWYRDKPAAETIYLTIAKQTG